LLNGSDVNRDSHYLTSNEFKNFVISKFPGSITDSGGKRPKLRLNKILNSLGKTSMRIKLTLRQMAKWFIHLLNSHGTRRLYPPRYEMAAFCQDNYFGLLRCLYHNYIVILVPKKFDSWSKKCHFRSIFGSFPVKFPSKNFFGKFLFHQKICL